MLNFKSDLMPHQIQRKRWVVLLSFPLPPPVSPFNVARKHSGNVPFHHGPFIVRPSNFMYQYKRQTTFEHQWVWLCFVSFCPFSLSSPTNQTPLCTFPWTLLGNAKRCKSKVEITTIAQILSISQEASLPLLQAIHCNLSHSIRLCNNILMTFYNMEGNTPH